MKLNYNITSSALPPHSRPGIPSKYQPKSALSRHLKPLLDILFSREFESKMSSNFRLLEKKKTKILKMEELTSFFYRTTSSLKEKLKNELSLLGRQRLKYQALLYLEI